MAEKRMFAKSIVLTDAFLDMPMSARCLYFTLGMLADDDGFVGSPKSIMRQCGASQDDLRMLLAKRFVLGFDSGVIVIKHWRINNYLQNDRHHPTTYQEELASLTIDNKGAYTEADGKMYTTCIQDVYADKNSIDKGSIDKNRSDKDNLTISVDMVCSTDVQRVIDRWNSLGLGQVNKVVAGTDRERLLKKRIKDYGIDEVLRAIENVRESKFLNGGNSKGWIITFDWFIRPNNFPKVLDGNYAKSSSGSKLDESYAMMERWASNDEG